MPQVVNVASLLCSVQVRSDDRHCKDCAEEVVAGMLNFLAYRDQCA